MAAPHLRHPPSGVGAVTSVTSATSNVVILAANANRLGATIFNRSNNRLFLRLQNSAATLVLYTHRLSSYELFLVPAGYQGEINGLWDPNVSGFALVTEFTP